MVELSFHPITREHTISKLIESVEIEEIALAGMQKAVECAVCCPEKLK